MTDDAGCMKDRLARQQSIEPSQDGVSRRRFVRRFRGRGRGRAGGGGLPRPRRQVLVDRSVAQFRHQVVAAALGDELGDSGLGIAEIAEMPRMDRTGRHAGRHAIDFLEVLVVDAVDAQRAFLHRAGVVVVLARAIRASPGAELAADAQALVDQHDAVLRPLVGGPGRTDLDTGRLLAMQAGAREMHGAAVGAVAGFVGVDAIEPYAQGIGAVGLAIGEGCHVAAGVPFLAIDRTGVTSDADIEIDDEAKLPFARDREGGHAVPLPADLLPQFPSVSCPGLTRTSICKLNWIWGGTM